MEFFEKAFTWLAGLSTKLPVIDFKMYFIIALAAIALVWVITALTLLSSRSKKLIRACKKIQKHLSTVDAIDDENVSEFTAACFGSKAPQALRDAWMQYLGVRFGYPSEIVSESAVYDKLVKKHKDVRSGVYLTISLILLAVFAFWGYGTLDSVDMGVVHCAGLLLIAITYLLLVLFYRSQVKKGLKAFENMQDDLDAKVNLQVESNYATDSSPLTELNALVEEIIARNTAKVVDVDGEEDNAPTPIEELIEQTPEADNVEEPQEPTDEEPSQEEPQEELVEEQEEVEEPTQEVALEEVEEPMVEDTVEEEPVEETAQEEEAVVEEQEELVEEPAVEESQEEVVEDTEEDEEPSNVVYDSAAGVGGVLSADYTITQDNDVEEENVEEETEAPQEAEPEVVYVVEGEEEEETDAKPAKLAKLPNLVDYMLTKNLTKAMKIQIATMLITAYKKFKDSADDRKIVVQCLTKVMNELQK